MKQPLLLSLLFSILSLNVQASLITVTSTNPFTTGEYVINTLNNNDRETPIRRNDDGNPTGGSNASRIVGQSFTATSSLTSLYSFVFRTNSANDFTSGGPTLSVLVSDITGGGHSIVSNDTFDLSGLNIAAGDYFNISYSDDSISLTAGSLYRRSLWLGADGAGLGNRVRVRRCRAAGGGR